MNSKIDNIPENVPWGRIVHFYGRATHVPESISDLESNDVTARTIAIKSLSRNLEHQDGVIQATPFAVPLIIEKLTSPDTKDKVAVLELLDLYFRSANFSAQSGLRDGLVSLKLSDLLDEKYLWPEFKSEKEDEMLWEESNPTDLEWFSWQWQTMDAIKCAKPIIEDYSKTGNDDERAAATELLAKIK